MLQGTHAIRYVVAAAVALVVAVSLTLALAASHVSSQGPSSPSGQPRLTAADRAAAPPQVAAAQDRLDASWQAQLSTTQAQLVQDKQKQDAAAAQAAGRQRAGAGAGDPAAPGGSVPDIIQQTFAPLGPAAVQWALTIARRESNYNPRAVNPSGASGLFQFMPSTFAKSPAGQAGKSIWDPAANAEAAAWMYSQGRQDEWSTNY